MKTAIVTGASRGIGAAIAQALAEEEYTLGLFGRDEAALASVQQSLTGEHLVYNVDVRDSGGLRFAFQEFFSETGSLEVLVNNAGVNTRRTLPISDQEICLGLRDWQVEMETNLTGPYICSSLAAHYMGEGSIINISSIKGKEATSSPGYGASKAGLIKLTKDCAKAWAPGIRVNCVAPGFIATDLTREGHKNPELAKKIAEMIPIGKIGLPEDISGAYLFFASEELSGYITGQTLYADGGIMASQGSPIGED